ncbi:MAG: response regulator [Anaerolineales bacterium]|jgi:pilus assembly protein CpaE
MTRILVIDDEPVYHEMIAHAMDANKYQFDFASSGTEGLQKAKSHKPDLIITDVMMPDIDGYEVTRLLRREPQFAHIPILVLTAQAGLQNKLKSFEAGADDHLTKPFEPEELAARLAALLRRAETSSTSSITGVVHEDARLIAVHSLRGGTGCSSLAVNLGVGLALLWNTPTILLDLSMVAGQVALMLNASLRRTWADIANYSLAVMDMEMLASIVGKHESGVEFIASPTFPTEAETITGDILDASLEILRKHYDYMVADLPHNFNDIVVHTLDTADLILLTTAPDLASIRAAAAALDTYSKLNYPPEKIKLVLNATFPKHGLPKNRIESALGVPIMVTIPYTPDRFVEAINFGQPLVSAKPDEPIGGLLEDLAFFLSRDAHKKTRPENPSETWKRVYKRYSERKK